MYTLSRHIKKLREYLLSNHKVRMIALVAALLSSLTLCTSYVLDSLENCNSVLNQTKEWITLLGNFSNIEQCIDTCVNTTGCNSYTYYKTPSDTSHYQQCWAYMNNHMWFPYAYSNSDCGRIIQACQSDVNCSYNGVCNSKTGNCSCDAGWYGYTCNNLNLLPAIPNTGYNYTNSSFNTSPWGGSIQYDSKNKVYSMMVAEMEYNCGINSWTTNSQIVFAQTSDNNYISKYSRINRMLVPFAHSPDIIYASNTNEYVLIYVHNKTNNDVPPCRLCNSGWTPSGCKSQNVSEVTAIRYISGDNLSVAWDINQWSNPIELYNIGEGDSNFAAQINDDGGLVGMMRTGATSLYLVTAKDWKDNSSYVLHNNGGDGNQDSPGLFPYLTENGMEDPYVWKDCNGRWHALFHNRMPADPYDSQLLCGSHAYSDTNGTKWILGGTAFSNTVVFNVTDENGEKYDNVTFSRRERPHLVFDGCKPAAITSGVEFYKDKTFTLIQPISH